jgi:hypothetical protein
MWCRNGDSSSYPAVAEGYKLFIQKYLRTSRKQSRIGSITMPCRGYTAFVKVLGQIAAEQHVECKAQVLQPGKGFACRCIPAIANDTAVTAPNINCL